MKTAIKTIAISAAATLGLLATVAHAQNGARLNDPAQLQREHNRAVAAGDWANDPYDSRSSDDLNRWQLARTGAAGSPSADDDQTLPPPAPAMAPETASTGADYSSDQTYSNDEPATTVTVVGPPHDARESSPDPDTNPQSTGTPATDTPYVNGGQPVAPDEDSSGMYQQKPQ